MKWLIYGAAIAAAYLGYKAVKPTIQTAVTGLVPPAGG